MQSAAASRSASGATSVAQPSAAAQRARHKRPERQAHLERVLVAEDGLTLHEAEELALGDEPGELAPGLADDDRLDRRGARELDLPGLLAETLRPVHLADQLGLRGEVVVEPGHRHAGRVGELAHADGGGAPLGEESQRRLDDPVSGRDRRGTRRRAHGGATYLNARSSARKGASKRRVVTAVEP